MKVNDTLVWRYKDGNRQYYTVIAIEGDKIPDLNGPDHFMTEWKCKIYKDNSGFFPADDVPERQTQQLIYTETLQSQYDEPIQLNDILLAYSTDVAALCLGFRIS